ncbi:MAG: hypothetical protein RLZZ387_3554 [Chloroflexota bacterium]|jgi:hypothetical protein
MTVERTIDFRYAPASRWTAICRPDGIKGTAIALATLVRQCELLGDDTGLRAAWPAVRDAVGYIEHLRERAYALPAGLRTVSGAARQLGYTHDAAGSRPTSTRCWQASARARHARSARTIGTIDLPLSGQVAIDITP